jgi:hypothetical protein
MLSRKQMLIAALGLLIALTAVTLSQQDQQDQQQQKKRKDREIPTQTGPAPVVQIADHARVVTPCPDSGAADSQIPLSVTVQNFSDPSILRYNWRASGGRIVGDGPTATWDLSGTAPGTYQATIEVDNNQNNGCTAFTTTKVVVRECIRPPVCPNVSIYCPETVALNTPVTYTANLSGGTAGITPVYNWTVTGGTITSGQGTSSIQVDATGLEGQSITANVSVEGYNLSCTATCTTQIPRQPLKCRQVDYYPPIRYNDEKARLDNYAISLQNEPNAKGTIIVFGGPKSNNADKQKRIKRAYDYLVNVRGISPDRLVTKDGGQRDQPTTELWIVPLGATDCP